MTEEIKEILDRLDFNEWEVDLYKVPITWSELYDIRDYITNLQKENLKLISENEAIKSIKYTVDETIYKSRNEKAIEYIKERKDLNWYADGVFVYELLNILEGGDE